MNTVNFLVLTQYDGAFIGPVAKLLGFVMEFLYNAFSSIGIENIGLCIITFTFVIRLLMMPLTVKQQKFSKMSAVMTPELNKIRDKYQGKTDNESVMRMNEEQKAIYAKYGVSPSGSCLQMLIQMPILFGLYRVIWSIPAYVPKVYDIYEKAAKILVDGGLISVNKNLAALVEAGGTAVTSSPENINYTIDALANGQIKWQAAVDAVSTAGLNVDVFTSSMEKASHINSFLGINLSQSPMELMGLALLIPVLAGFTQWFSARLMMASNQTNNNKADDPTAGTMKMMNNMMPLMSVVFCFMFSCGIGLYWIAGSVIQILTQVALNAYFKKVSIEQMIEKNLEKVNKKRAKQGLPPQKITDTAAISTRTIASQAASRPAATSNKKNPATSYQNKAKGGDGNSQGMRTVGKPGSLTEKANLVGQYNDKHSKK